MNISLFLETIKHLRPRQVIYQLKFRLYRPKLKAGYFSMGSHTMRIDPPIAKIKCYDGNGLFTFLNISSKFKGWNIKEHGPLWSYNLNYMDWLQQEDISTEECLKWIDKFINELPENHIGIDPYPTALRIINWAKFFCEHPKCLNQRRCESMYAQTMLLKKRLEYHLLGNHLLEDAYALFIASIFFSDDSLYKKAVHLLSQQLQEQILPDGAHYEQSPMYHCIMLDRLLDCINFSNNNLLFKDQEALTNMLKEIATKMLGHLQSIIYHDGTIPLLNDSAFDIAPTANQLFQYAERLHLSWEATPLKECGYRKLGNNSMEITVDIGNITASYQPGHSHADTFNYELHIDCQPLIIDTGISTYDKNERRQYERGTTAHNTVTVKGENSSRVWGGFRMGKRAKVTVVKDDFTEIMAHHNGFGRHAIHQRQFSFKEDVLCITDNIIGQTCHNAISYIHFSPQTHVQIISETDGIVKAGCILIKIEGFNGLRLKQNYVSFRYNKLMSCNVLEIEFCSRLKYSIARVSNANA